MAQEHWYVDLRSGETKAHTVKAGQRVWVTHAKLVDPASAAAGQTVCAALRTNTGDDQSLVLSAESPVARMRDTEILEDEFWLERGEDDSADAVVRFRGRGVNLFSSRPPETVEDEDGVEELDVEDDDDEEVVGIEDGEEMAQEYEATDEDMSGDDNVGISDYEEEGEDGEEMPEEYEATDEMSDDGDGISDQNEDGEDHVEVLEEEEDEDREAAGSEDDEEIVEEYDVTDDNVGISDYEEEEEEEEEDGEEMPEEYEATDEMSDDGDGIRDQDEDEGGEDFEAVLEEEDDEEAEAAGSEDDEKIVEEYEVTDDNVGISEEEEGQFDVSLLLQMVQQQPGFLEFRLQGAAAGSTAGFMRVVTSADAESQGGSDNGRQILVIYHYTLFSSTSLDGRVEACGSTMEHHLRFTADASHGVRSLAWAGASLVPLIYPGHSSNQLRKLWPRLIPDVIIPPHATRVEVFVEVGLLWLTDLTSASMRHMCSILKSNMTKPWPESFTGMELNLPQPVRCGHGDEDNDNDTDGEEWPARRRRVVATGENCTICLNLLEGDDLAAWPGCGKPHVFHGRCMELVLQKNKTCPICRRTLYTDQA